MSAPLGTDAFVTGLFVDSGANAPSRFAALSQLWRTGEMRILTRSGPQVFLSTSISITGDVIVGVLAREWTSATPERFRAMTASHIAGLEREIARMGPAVEMLRIWATRGFWAASAGTSAAGAMIHPAGLISGAGLGLILRYLPRRWTLAPVRWGLGSYARYRFRQFLRGH